ncbi:hypothetical protein EYC80_003176 [Monilinia laxa]|uniref:histidine kinase n=1 Tax=Monilinia laxa TaxID=61186 RepID=A0A5N6KD53_MONLA|nr:hypothetical protein EYC80_003176 [Monilinia laxa]
MLSSSERKRIREVRRYYKRSPDDPPIAGENLPAESPETVRSVEKASSPNSTLTALMQLITWRLGAGRAMVSVVDDNAQYFLAEATKTLDLSDSSKHDPGDDLWMGCGGTIRSQALCAYTIEVVPEPNHYACFSVPDLLADPRFCNLPYVAEGPKFRYYAGTPLISNTGIPIGSVFIIDPRPREPATRAEIDFLGLMAKNVMEYLEMKRESVQLRRNDVMSKGLAALVEGQSRIPRQVMTDIIVNCQEVNGTHLDESGMINTGLTSSLVVDTSLATVAEQSLNNIVRPPQSLDGENLLYDISSTNPIGPLTSDDTPATHGRILSRGANLLRESLNVDYTIFFDMSVGFSTSVEHEHNGELRSSEDTILDASDTNNNFNSTSTHSGQEDDLNPLDISVRSCSLNRRSNEAGLAKVRSFSTSTASSLDGETLSCNLYRAPNERDLQRLSKRYPKGKVWTFNGYDSESSEGEDSPPCDQMFALQMNSRYNHRVRKTDRSILKHCFPDAREVLFAPLSEAGTGLPISACFAVSLRDIAIFTSDTEKAFVRGFLNSVSIEYNRISIAAADRQKGDFISSISHELRSPLHGILGSAELMSETNLDNGQFELCSTIETCGRVLQETLMDVLEYSKLNNLMRNKGTGGKIPYTNGDTSHSQQSNSENITRGDIVSLPLDLARMCEDSVAIVAAAYMHHSTNSDHLLYRVIQPPGATNRQEGQILYKSSSVAVSLHITFDDWHYFCSPGSVQRIIMNLVAFSQESSLAPGTGLGLHIVDSLVRMYNGTIDVQSQIGHGTTVTVKLPLAKAVSDLSCVTPGKLVPKNQVKEVKDLLKQFQYTTFSTHGFQSGSPGYLKKSLLAYLTQWFEMDHDAQNRAPDIAFVTEESLEIFLSNLMIDATLRPSLIIVVRYVPSHGYISQQSSAIGIPLETLTVPFGPWKLLKTLLACLSPKQASPSPPPIIEPRILYISPLPSPTPDIQRELVVTDQPMTGEVLPSSSLTTTQDSLKPSQPTILCVDDNPINLRLLRAYFRKLQFEITCAENGAVAFEKYRLKANGFDLVFMDISMPICDGYQSTRMIRSLDKLQQSISPIPLPPTRIVALSAAYSDTDMEKAKAAGVDDFYTKPMKVSKLEILMRGWGYLDLRSEKESC